MRTDWLPQTKTMSGWIKIRVEFIKGLAGQWKGSSHPKDPVKPRIPWQRKRLAPIALRSGRRAR